MSMMDPMAAPPEPMGAPPEGPPPMDPNVDPEGNEILEGSGPAEDAVPIAVSAEQLQELQEAGEVEVVVDLEEQPVTVRLFMDEGGDLEDLDGLPPEGEEELTDEDLQIGVPADAGAMGMDEAGVM